MAVRTDRTAPFQDSVGAVFSEKSGIHQESSTALHKVGTRMKLSDGRTFYYAKNGGTAVTEPGRVMGAIKQVASESDTSITEVAGTREIAVTAVAATGVSYVGGYFVVATGTGQGQTHKIADCTTTAAAGTATVYLYDELVTALTAATAVMTINPFWGLGVGTTEGQIMLVLGVTPIAVTANYYFWLQTWGWASCLSGDSLGADGAGDERVCTTSTTGVSTLSTAAEAVAGAQVIGYRSYDSADTVSGEWDLNYLTCMP